MKPLNYEQLRDFVNHEIERFHLARLARLEKLKLHDVLKRKNPYLFRAKNLRTANDFVKSILDAFLSSSEEELFGKFLEALAIYVAAESTGGRKSSAEGIDLEFEIERVRYLVSIKSGPSWGNSSQIKKLEDNFKKALKVQQQGRDVEHVKAVLGICYGKPKRSLMGVYEKIVGQTFWHFISGDPHLYIEIVEPIGYRASEHNAYFDAERAKLEDRFTQAFMTDFCQEDGTIAWAKLVAFTSQNLDETDY